MAVDPKTFDKLYTRGPSMALQMTGPHTQAAFVEVPQSTTFEGQTQTQVQVSNLPKALSLTGMGRDTGVSDGAVDPLMDVEL